MLSLDHKFINYDYYVVYLFVTIVKYPFCQLVALLRNKFCKRYFNVVYLFKGLQIS